MFKTFLIVLSFLAAIAGHIYVCTYTNVSDFICFLPPLVIAGLAGFAATGGKLPGKGVVAKDDQGNRIVSRFWGVSILVLVALMIFTVIALAER